MNFFKMKTSWSNAEFIPLKLCIASIYLVIGAYFHEFVGNYYGILLTIFGVTAVWAVYLWISKMKREK